MKRLREKSVVSDEYTEFEKRLDPIITKTLKDDKIYGFSDGYYDWCVPSNEVLYNENKGYIYGEGDDSEANWIVNVPVSYLGARWEGTGNSIVDDEINSSNEYSIEVATEDFIDEYKDEIPELDDFNPKRDGLYSFLSDLGMEDKAEEYETDYEDAYIGEDEGTLTLEIHLQENFTLKAYLLFYHDYTFESVDESEVQIDPSMSDNEIKKSILNLVEDVTSDFN